MNKIFIVIFVLAVTHKAYAVDLKKAKEFLSKKTPCHFAFSAKLGDEVPNAVFCVWDGVLYPNTVRESKGCFLGKYDMSNDNYQPLAKYGVALMAVNQPKGNCTKQLVEDILIKYPMKERTSFGSGEMPFLVEFKKNSQSIEVLADNFGIYSDELSKKIENWKSAKKSKSKKVNCDSDQISDQDEVLYCRTADQLQSGFCSVNMSNEDACLYLEAYKNQTGKSEIECRKDSIKNKCKK